MMSIVEFDGLVTETEERFAEMLRDNSSKEEMLCYIKGRIDLCDGIDYETVMVERLGDVFQDYCVSK